MNSDQILLAGLGIILIWLIITMYAAFIYPQKVEQVRKRKEAREKEWWEAVNERKSLLEGIASHGVVPVVGNRKFKYRFDGHPHDYRMQII